MKSGISKALKVIGVGSILFGAICLAKGVSEVIEEERELAKEKKLQKNPEDYKENKAESIGKGVLNKEDILAQGSDMPDDYDKFEEESLEELAQV